MEISAVVQPKPARKDKAGNPVPEVKGGSAKANFNMPADLAGMAKTFGEAVTYEFAKSAIVIAVQALMRRMIQAGKSAAEIQQAVSGFKPDVRTAVRMTASEKAIQALRSLTPEERLKVLQEYQAQAQAQAKK